MADRFILSRVRSLPLFARLSPEQLDTVAEAFQVMRFAEGQTIFRQGQPTQGLMLLASGRAVLLRNEQQIGMVTAGQYLNQAALYGEGIESATLRAAEDSIVLMLTRAAFGELLEDPALRATLRANARGDQPSTPPPSPVWTPEAPPPQSTIPQFQQIASSGEGNVPTVRADGGRIAPPPRTPPRQAAPAPAQAASSAPSSPPPHRQAPPPVQNEPPQSPPGVLAPVPVEHKLVREKVFRGQYDDETVLYMFRRHWWAFGRFWWLVVLLAAPFFVGAYLLLNTANPLGFLVAFGGVLFPALLVFYFYHEWQDDSIIVTDSRVVRVWNHLIGFQNEVIEIPLDRVIEVSVIQPPGDPIARLFDYATVFVRTSGDASTLELSMIPNPLMVRTSIFASRDRYVDSIGEVEAQAMRAEVANALRGGHLQVPSAAEGLPAPKPINESTHGLPFIRTKFQAPNGDIVYRKHSTVWLQHVLPPLVVMLVAGAVLFFGTLNLLPLPPVIADAVGVVVLIIGGIWFYLADWDWRNDIFRVGEDTVTLVHKRPLWLQNEIVSLRIAQIDSVLSEINGFINNVLDRGDVRISLIGSNLGDAKVLANVYMPEEIAAEISHRIRVVKEARQREEVEREKNTMLQYLRLYDEIQRGGDPGQVVRPNPRPPDPYAQSPRPNPPPRPPRRGTS